VIASFAIPSCASIVDLMASILRLGLWIREAEEQMALMTPPFLPRSLPKHADAGRRRLLSRAATAARTVARGTARVSLTADPALGALCCGSVMDLVSGPGLYFVGGCLVRRRRRPLAVGGSD
jgi:hypothetical protein